jgi:hypothetical protein
MNADWTEILTTAVMVAGVCFIVWNNNRHDD